MYHINMIHALDKGKSRGQAYKNIVYVASIYKNLELCKLIKPLWRL